MLNKEEGDQQPTPPAKKLEKLEANQMQRKQRTEMIKTGVKQ